MKKLIIIIFMFLIACVSVEKYDTHTVINNHRGGKIIAVVQEIDNYKKPIKIKGLCGSSCTYAFKFKDTCVYKNADIVFHLARNKDGSTNKPYSDLMSEWYPKTLNLYFKTIKDQNDYYFTGSQLNKLFNIPLCTRKNHD